MRRLSIHTHHLKVRLAFQPYNNVAAFMHGLNWGPKGLQVLFLLHVSRPTLSREGERNGGKETGRTGKIDGAGDQPAFEVLGPT